MRWVECGIIAADRVFRLLQQVTYKLVLPVPSLITELLLQNVDAIPHQVVS